jgi:7-dehydrocholesterol reductase
VTNSIVLAVLLRLLVVLDFFANKKWYVFLKLPSLNWRLRIFTKIPRFIGILDIAYKHFGFYYIYGYSAFIPMIYTL